MDGYQCDPPPPLVYPGIRLMRGAEARGSQGGSGGRRRLEEFTLRPSREVTPSDNDMDEMHCMRYIMGTSLKLFPLKRQVFDSKHIRAGMIGCAG